MVVRPTIARLSAVVAVLLLTAPIPPSLLLQADQVIQ